ncbi:MAG: hypothetical protein AABW63_02675 [Nanoarchaeota archaeon]|mgnify:CR=1 FL=1
MGTQIGIDKIITIILVVLVVAAVLFFVFKTDVIKWVKQIFPDFIFGGII